MTIISESKLKKEDGSYILQENGDFIVLTYVYSMLLDIGNYILTGFNTFFYKQKTLIADLGSYVLTGISINLYKIWKYLTATLGSYLLTGQNSLFYKYLHLVSSTGNYILTGINTVLHKVLKPLVTSVGSYILTGQSALFYKLWMLISNTGHYTITGFKIRIIAPIHTFWKEKVVTSTTWKKLIQPITNTVWNLKDKGN